jgi:drug/metabolite transporter (DMT)-like permease
MKIDWKRKLTSRKLWVAVADFVGMLMIAFGVAEETVTQVAALIMAGAGAVAYVIAEGLTDAAAIEVKPDEE